MHQKLLVSEEKLEQARATIRALENRRDDLSQKVAYLSTNEGIEAEMRSKFRLAEEGESVAVITGTMENESIIDPATSTKKNSAWQKVKGSFGF